MADATVAVKMLLSTSPLEAYNYAKVLDEQNLKRQEVERTIYEQAVERIEQEGLNKKKSHPIHQ